MWSRQKRIAPESGKYSPLGRAASVTAAAHSRSARVISTLRDVLQQLAGDGHHLFRGLALGEDHLRHAVAQRAMVVHLGESQIFEGHVAHAHHGRIDIHGAAANLFEHRPKLLLIHEARITERRGLSGAAAFARASPHRDVRARPSGAAAFAGASPHRDVSARTAFCAAVSAGAFRPGGFSACRVFP